MVADIRKKYNSLFREEEYNDFIEDIQESTDGALDFKICETPLFLDIKSTEILIEAAYSIARELRSDCFTQHSENAVPDRFDVPNENDHPLFLQIDFGITKDTEGNFLPQVIELQGFPSLYAYQAFLDSMVTKHFYIPDGYTTYFSGLDFNSYIRKLSKILLNDHQAENVILLEIEPWKQKTRIDFFCTKLYCGIDSICISDVIKRGRRLFYEKDGREIPIERIYNRVIFDELISSNVEYNFDFRDDLEVEWAGHPNWFFKISKHTLPFLNNKYSPDTYFLHELTTYPDDLDNFVLKPLYSFAGSGVVVDVDKNILDSIKDKENFILQRKVEYAPLIETPDGYSKAEIRMMFLWDEEPFLVNNLLRTSKGKMMGVDYNKNKTWIGSNVVYHP